MKSFTVHQLVNSYEDLPRHRIKETRVTVFSRHWSSQWNVSQGFLNEFRNFGSSPKPPLPNFLSRVSADASIRQSAALSPCLTATDTLDKSELALASPPRFARAAALPYVSGEFAESPEIEDFQKIEKISSAALNHTASCRKDCEYCCRANFIESKHNLNTIS